MRRMKTCGRAVERCGRARRMETFGQGRDGVDETRAERTGRGGVMRPAPNGPVRSGGWFSAGLRPRYGPSGSARAPTPPRPVRFGAGLPTPPRPSGSGGSPDPAAALTEGLPVGSGRRRADRSPRPSPTGEPADETCGRAVGGDPSGARRPAPNGTGRPSGSAGLRVPVGRRHGLDRRTTRTRRRPGRGRNKPAQGIAWETSPREPQTSLEDDPMRRTVGDVSAVGRAGTALRRAAVGVRDVCLAAMPPVVPAARRRPAGRAAGGAARGREFGPGHRSRCSRRTRPMPPTSAVSLPWRKGTTTRRSLNFTEAIRLDPRLATAYAERRRARGRKNELDMALADCNAAIRTRPPTGQGLCLSRHGVVVPERDRQRPGRP